MRLFTHFKLLVLTLPLVLSQVVKVAVVVLVEDRLVENKNLLGNFETLGITELISKSRAGTISFLRLSLLFCGVNTVLGQSLRIFVGGDCGTARVRHFLIIFCW